MLVCLAEGFRCQYEEDLDPGTNATEFTIKPQLTLDGQFLWITNMNMFLFGSISMPKNTKIEAGFYNSDTGAMVYKVIIDCQNGGKWKTMYDRTGNGNARKWKEGTIDGGCPKGPFDLIGSVGCLDHELDLHDEDFPLPCAKMAYFVFNGQVLENNLQQIERWYNVQHQYLGAHYAEALPVYIRTAKLFKARVMRRGATFDQEAYGKCVEFPSRFHDNCTKAREFVLSRSNSVNTPVSVPDMAPLNQINAPTCTQPSDPDQPVQFKTVQFNVMPDGASIQHGISSQTCCCSYSDGFPTDCKNNWINQTNCNYRYGMDDLERRCAKYDRPLRVYNAATGRYELKPIDK